MMYFFNNGRLLLILLNLLLILLGTGCATTLETTRANNRNHTSLLTGQVLLANGTTPIKSVTVYIPNVEQKTTIFINELSLNSSSQAKRACEKPLAAYFSFSCTDVNGHFELPVTKLSTFPLSIIVQNSDDTVSTDIAINELDSDIGIITMSDNQSSVPTRHGADKNKIAIVFDLLDPYEEINRTLVENNINPDLVRIDMLNNFYEIYEINESQNDVDITTLQELVKDQNKDTLADIADYDIIFINCRDEDDIAKLSTKIRRELLKFVSNGGELFITSWSLQLEEPELDLNEYI